MYGNMFESTIMLIIWLFYPATNNQIMTSASNSSQFDGDIPRGFKTPKSAIKLFYLSVTHPMNHPLTISFISWFNLSLMDDTCMNKIIENVVLQIKIISCMLNFVMRSYLCLIGLFSLLIQLSFENYVESFEEFLEHKHLMINHH